MFAQVHTQDKNAKCAKSKGMGVVKGNPHFCIRCAEPIREGDRWTKYTSAPHPKYGAYTLIVHERCRRGVR